MGACCHIQRVVFSVNCLPLQFSPDVPYANVVNNGEMLDFAIQIAKGMVGTWIHPCFIYTAYTALYICCTKLYIIV